MRRCIFEYIFLNYNSLSLDYRLWRLIDVNKGNNFPESFEQFGGLGGQGGGGRGKFQVLLNLAICTDSSITSYVDFSVLFFFEKVNKEHLKMVNVNY